MIGPDRPEAIVAIRPDWFKMTSNYNRWSLHDLSEMTKTTR